MTDISGFGLASHLEIYVKIQIYLHILILKMRY